MFNLRLTTALLTILSPSILLINQAGAIAASKAYNGIDVNVNMSCVKIDNQSEGSYSLDGRKSGTAIAAVTGLAYFENDPRSARVINDTARNPAGDMNFRGSAFDYGFIAINFSVAIVAAGNAADGSAVISLPELDDPNDIFGFSVNCDR